MTIASWSRQRWPPFLFRRSGLGPCLPGHFRQQFHFQGGTDPISNDFFGVVAAARLGLQPHGNDVLVGRLLDVFPDDVQEQLGQGAIAGIVLGDLRQDGCPQE